MKLADSFVLLAVISVAHGSGHNSRHGTGSAAVYELSNQGSETSQKVSMDSALLYLADKIGLDDFYSLGKKTEAIELIDSLHKSQSSKPSLLVIMKGVDTPSTLAGDRNPTFEIHMENPNAPRRLVKILFKKFPKQYAKSVNVSHVSHLTDEIKFVSSTSSEQLRREFHLLHRDLPQSWSSVVKTFSWKQSAIANLNSSLQLVNDKLYISDLMQLLKLSKHTEEHEMPAFIVANLDSLYSLGSKIGYDSRTYQIAKSTLMDSIEALQSICDVTIVALSPEHKHACDKHRMSKGSQELGELFSKFAKRETFPVGSCFSEESECQAATDNCNQHGVCTKVRSKCWQCLCSATYDKKTFKTTKWTGFDCSKKDIAAQTQLLLWSSIGLLVALVGGIKLLFSIGNDSLPGVLEVATIKTAS